MLPLLGHKYMLHLSVCYHNLATSICCIYQYATIPWHQVYASSISMLPFLGIKYMLHQSVCYHSLASSICCIHKYASITWPQVYAASISMLPYIGPQHICIYLDATIPWPPASIRITLTNIVRLILYYHEPDYPINDWFMCGGFRCLSYVQSVLRHFYWVIINCWHKF